ncbi:outer membrane protein [Hoeflea sp.]|uniref:outer membrane protein n=1 Tax=Hoeflea sp. TaxID=1940281 RepID=UPI003B029321
MRKAVLTGALVCALPFAAAHAADDIVAPADEPWSPHLYVSGAIGAVFTPEQTRVSPGATFLYDFDTGYAIQGAVGLELPYNLRTEAELTYRSNDLDNDFVSVGVGTLDSTGDLDVTTIMANLIYDYEIGNGFAVFAGGGIGAAYLDINFARGPGGFPPGFVLDRGNDWRFAYQFIGGASYEFRPGTSNSNFGIFGILKSLDL